MIAASEWEIGWDGACARPTAVRMSLDIECRVTDKIEMELPTVSRGCCWSVRGVRGWMGVSDDGIVRDCNVLLCIT
jgi:hypothetical protein